MALNEKERKDGAQKLDKSKNTTQNQLINEVIIDSTISKVLIKAFNIWYDKSVYYLAMCPLDNDVKLKNYIITATDFLSLLEEFQSKYNIYKYGYNVYIDGNIIFILNKVDENKLEFESEYTYKIISIPEHVNTQGHYLNIIDNNTKEITIYHPSVHIQFGGHFNDYMADTNLAVNSETGEASNTVNKTSVFQKVVVDNVDPAAVSGTDTAKEDVKYDILYITFNNTYLTFIPGDKLQVIDKEKPDFVWEGTVKRWASQQIGMQRGVFLLALGTLKPVGGNSGNSFINNILNAPEYIQQVSNAITNDVKKVADEVGKIATSLPKAYEAVKADVLSYGKQAKNLADKFIDDTYDRIAHDVENVLDETGLKRVINDAINYGEALWNSPVTRPIVERGLLSLAKILHTKVSTVTELVKNDSTSHPSLNLEYLENLGGGGDVGKDADLVNDMLDLKAKYYLFGDGYDALINQRMLYDIDLKQDIVAIEFNKIQELENPTDEYKIFADAVFSNLDIVNRSPETWSILRHSYVNLSYFIDYLRELYKKSLTIERKIPDKIEHTFAINKDDLEELEDGLKFLDERLKPHVLKLIDIKLEEDRKKLEELRGHKKKEEKEEKPAVLLSDAELT